ncbi:MAG: hypothetical protein AAGB10_02305 [Pseudomonadota bacterium]
MFPITGLALGALWGWYQAERRNGTTLDKAQYAAGFGIAGGILGLLAAIIYIRLGGG